MTNSIKFISNGKKIKLNTMYKRYQTNQQAWNEVMSGIKESERRTKICLEMFGQENLIGLSNEKRELFWESI